jgi:hypothetical protein
MVTEKVRVLPINVQSFHGPAIGSRGCTDTGALCFGAVFAKTGAVVGKGKQRITAWPGVRTGAELVSEP